MEYTDEQRQLIEEAWAELHANDAAPEGEEEEARTVSEYEEEHSKTHEDLEHRLLAFALVIEVTIDKINEMSNDLARVCTFIDETLIGGAKKQAELGARRIGIGEVISKYGSMVGPYEDAYMNADWGGEKPEPIYDQLYDLIQELKMQADYSEDKEKSEVERVVGEFKTRFPEVGKPPVEEKSEEQKSEEEGANNAREYVKRMLEARKAAGIKRDVEY
jgi:hypothetical protein